MPAPLHYQPAQACADRIESGRKPDLVPAIHIVGVLSRYIVNTESRRFVDAEPHQLRGLLVPDRAIRPACPSIPGELVDQIGR